MDDPLAEMDALPWGRINHWYGRADDIPPLIRALGTYDHRRAEDELRWKLEHQWASFRLLRRPFHSFAPCFAPAAAAIRSRCFGSSKRPRATYSKTPADWRSRSARSRYSPPNVFGLPYCDEVAEELLWGSPIDDLEVRDASWALEIEAELATLWRTLPPGDAG